MIFQSSKPQVCASLFFCSLLCFDLKSLCLEDTYIFFHTTCTCIIHVSCIHIYTYIAILSSGTNHSGLSWHRSSCYWACSENPRCLSHQAAGAHFGIKKIPQCLYIVNTPVVFNRPMIILITYREEKRTNSTVTVFTIILMNDIYTLGYIYIYMHDIIYI